MLADIPITKIDTVPAMRKFYEKWVNKKPLPKAATLKSRYLPQTYNKSISEVRKKLGNDRLWITMDETTDSSKRNIGILVIGSLDNKNIGPYTLHFDMLGTTRSIGIAQFFRDSLAILFEG